MKYDVEIALRSVEKRWPGGTKDGKVRVVRSWELWTYIESVVHPCKYLMLHFIKDLLENA